MTRLDLKADGSEFEDGFQSRVVKLAQLYGWYVYEVYDQRRNRAGWLDLWLCREKVLYVELKTGKNKTSKAQREMIDRLSDAGQNVFVWYPEHWDSGVIEATLQREE